MELTSSLANKTRPLTANSACYSILSDVRSTQVPASADVKKVSRLIFRLTRDIEFQSPGQPLPSSWMIRCLAKTHLCGLHALSTDWRTTISWTLMHICQDIQSSHGENSFVHIDGFTPLFPNNENFSDTDLHLFCQAALKHINQTS